MVNLLIGISGYVSAKTEVSEGRNAAEMVKDGASQQKAAGNAFEAAADMDCFEGSALSGVINEGNVSEMIKEGSIGVEAVTNAINDTACPDQLVVLEMLQKGVENKEAIESALRNAAFDGLQMFDASIISEGSNLAVRLLAATSSLGVVRVSIPYTREVRNYEEARK